MPIKPLPAQVSDVTHPDSAKGAKGERTSDLPAPYAKRNKIDKSGASMKNNANALDVFDEDLKALRDSTSTRSSSMLGSTTNDSPAIYPDDMDKAEAAMKKNWETIAKRMKEDQTAGSQYGTLLTKLLSFSSGKDRK